MDSELTSSLGCVDCGDSAGILFRFVIVCAPFDAGKSAGDIASSSVGEEGGI